MHLVQVCDCLTKQVRWVNIHNRQTVLKAADWAGIASWSGHPDIQEWKKAS